MKTLLSTGCVLAFVLSAMSQSVPDLSWKFQWGTNTCGLLFENTNLTVGVKAAIRDDVQTAYYAIPPSNAVYRAYQSGEEEYGKFLGHMYIQGAYTCPRDLSGWSYAVYGGTNFFFVEADVCSNYLAKIALTNQYDVAIGSLSNFLVAAETMTIANTSTNAFLQKFWHYNSNRIPDISDDPAFKFLDYVQEWGSVYYINPSILQFEYGSLEGLICLHAEIKTVNKTEPDKRSNVYVVYKDAQWRFLVWEW
jgi:hypothetical protein